MKVSPAVTSLVAAWLLRALSATQRLRFHGEETIRRRQRDGQPYILAFWHRHLLLMRWGYPGRRITVLISQSKDGELIARTIQRLGRDFRSARGSSSRGAVGGLRRLVQAARAGDDIGFTPDGPRGPAREVQPGVVAVAAMTGLEIIPAALAASRALHLRTWDRMPLPLPFARVHFVYGEPLRVGRDDDLDAAAAALKRRLDAAEARAEALAAGMAMGDVE